MVKLDKETHTKLIKVNDLFKEHYELFKKIGPYRRYEILSAVEDARHPKRTTTSSGREDDDYHSFNYRDKSHYKEGALKDRVDSATVVEYYNALYKDVNVITELIQETAGLQCRFNSKLATISKVPTNPIQELIHANPKSTFPTPHIYGIFRPLFKGQASKKQYETVKYIDQETVKRFPFSAFVAGAYVVPLVQFDDSGNHITDIEQMSYDKGFPLGVITSSDPATELINVKIINDNNVESIVALPQSSVMPMFSLVHDQIPSIKGNQSCLAILPGSDYFFPAKSPNYKKGENLYKVVFNNFPGEYNVSPEAVTFMWPVMQELWKNDPKKAK